jgi:RNA polymerase sigma-70 factor (sigma-E family)
MSSFLGVRVAAPDGFAAFVQTRSPSLLRSAWLLTGDWASAQDLVQVALSKTWQRWDHLIRRDEPEVYVRRVMFNTYATWRRRRWSGEIPTEALPELPVADAAFDDLERRDALLTALASLPRRQRAVIVLRYFDDLTERQTAAVLGCAVGTVKSSTAKALAQLRAHSALRGLLAEENTP